ncbi:MAG: FtsP/CotA-like multicopper oxidase with cupredoxin domain [Gammaproteobacteria bacterium]|jgi:FtsP/CotA-like multicopper oxidase with cupredoxin domain
MSKCNLHSLLIAGFLLTCCVVIPLSAQVPESIVANDNRLAAGDLHEGVLTLHLELRKGIWHPEGEDGEAIPVYAFGEAGKPLQVPAPLLRVPEGTMVEVSVHNTLGVPASVHGLHEHPGDAGDVVNVNAGENLTMRFRAGDAGTYLYWASTPDGGRGNRRVVDSLVGGALVIDAPNASIDDRIFVLERWNGPTRTAINGKSWPFTERLNVEAGKPEHWRVINASDLSHPMHLHGLHFNVDGVGDGEHYRSYAPEDRPLIFTKIVEIGETFDMTWVPHEPGRWLFHCHRVPHMRLPVNLDPSDVMVLDNHEQAKEDPLYAGMGGMIMEITVNGPHTQTPEAVWQSARKLELEVDTRNGDLRFYALTLRDHALAQSMPNGQSSPALTGPVIVLEQGQPVEIGVVNRLDVATAIHWHGMELESYYDGVPIVSGIGDMRAPPVEPGKRFVARMTPPRAGTLMYHTHWHDPRQLTGGVHGPLIVMPAGQTYDPSTDKAFLFSQSPGEPFGASMLLMNGNPQPRTMEFKTGIKYRFRFINITPSVANLRVSLRQAGVPVEWRAVAKDAIDLPSSKATLRRADLQVSVGETYDFEFKADGPMELTLEGGRPDNTQRVVQTIVFTDPLM